MAERRYWGSGRVEAVGPHVTDENGAVRRASSPRKGRANWRCSGDESDALHQRAEQQRRKALDHGLHLLELWVIVMADAAGTIGQSRLAISQGGFSLNAAHNGAR